MQIVLLSGGKGKRLWPLSTNDLPKQFLECFDNNESMLSITYKKAQKINPKIYVSTQAEYIDIIKKQTSHNVEVITEPYSNDTFAAFLNIAMFLKCNQGFSEDEIICLLPVDHDVDNEFYNELIVAKNKLIDSDYDLCLIGVKPFFPSTQYGYILENNGIVSSFIEKPMETEAIELIKNNAVWNSGILIFKLEYMIDIAHKYCGCKEYSSFLKSYSQLPKISFDREILEKERNIALIITNKKWNDLGTWDRLSNKISKPDLYNTNIINYENKKVKNHGVENSIIINSKEGIALYKKAQEKTYRNWGYYQILNQYKFNGIEFKIKLLKIFANHNISYQSHIYRQETWMILKGKGIIFINGELKEIEAGDTIHVGVNNLHAIKAITDLEVFEIQNGVKTIEEDINRIEYDWDKIISINKE